MGLLMTKRFSELFPGGGHQDNRPGGGGGRDRGHPAGDHGPLTVRLALRYQILRLIS